MSQAELAQAQAKFEKAQAHAAAVVSGVSGGDAMLRPQTAPGKTVGGGYPEGVAAPGAASSSGSRGDPQDFEDLAPRLSVHEANRVKKAAETNVKAIENRIRFFQREELKIWRDLEEVRRQAATIEEGRARTLEKKMAHRTIEEAKAASKMENAAKAAVMKKTITEQRRQNQAASMQLKRQVGDEQRRASQDILRQKRMNEAKQRLQNSERAVAIQRQQLEAKLKINQERSEKLDQLRDQQEAERIAAELEVQEVESRLPALEVEEMVCLQRLQNSRIVTQSVLEELESSLGTRSSVASLLRAKSKQQEHLDSVRDSAQDGEERFDGEPPLDDPQYQGA
eukprot:TRINITY_DN70537_c0_g1_i1.p1 TRINITY_DN70537_c0_g1~~TRINITY_DN70537_c0_g1_i1.p1  ORF type:complete len:364 (+),score=109.20 TRINITY_DN70537_c0_g1_i1:77-1093(+)